MASKDFIVKNGLVVGTTSDSASSGQLAWHDSDGTVQLSLGGVLKLKLGQQNYYYAKASEAIAKGDLVMFAGAQGDHILVAKADQSAVGFLPQHVMGIAPLAIANNEFGHVTAFGAVENLDTSSYTAGDLLYMDPDNAGQLTTTKPSPPDHILLIAAVTRSNANEGVMIVRPTHQPDTSEVPENSTNLYYTTARVDSDIDAKVTKSYIEAFNINASNADTLDSVSSESFLRSDVADTKTSGDLSFSDNVKAIFGDGSDLQIYHTGSTSYIYEQGTGDLRIRGSEVRIEDDDGSTIALFREDQGAQLRYNGNIKLESTNTGIDVTGSIRVLNGGSSSFDNLIDIRDDSNDTRLQFTRTDTDANAWVGIPSWNDDAFYIYGPTSSGNEVAAIYTNQAWSFYGGGSSKLTTNSTGIDVNGTIVTDALTSSGLIKLDYNNPRIDFVGDDSIIYRVAVDETNNRLTLGHSTNRALFLANTGDSRFAYNLTVDSDLTVSGDTTITGVLNVDSNTLYVDTPDSRVGIGTDNPLYELQVNGSIYAYTGSIFLDSGNRLKWGNSQQFIEATNDTSMEFGTNGSTSMIIMDNGNVGIGTTNPTNLLHVKSTVNNGSVITLESTATDSYPFLRLKNDAREYQITAHGPLSDIFTIYDGTAGAHRFVIDTSGDVGIGTTNPVVQLDLDGGAFRVKDAVQHNFGSETSNAAIILGTASSNQRRIVVDQGGYGRNLIGIDADNDVIIGQTATSLLRNLVVNQSGAGGGGHVIVKSSVQENVRIEQGGDVGIGTNSPDYKTHIVGDFRADSAHLEAIVLDKKAGHIAYKEGAVWYDTEHSTLNYYSDDSDVVHEIGIEEHQKVYNNTGSTITKGSPLYFSGNYTSGTHDVPTVGLANATDVNAYNAQGLAASDIADGSYGYCIISGQLDGVNTSGLSAGTNFFVGLSAGAVQNASPVYPNYPMRLGWVVKSDSADGILLVNQQNHSVNSFRVRTSAHIGDDLQVDGNLTVLGTQTIASSENISIGGAFNYLNAGDTIGETNTSFTGSGLDDGYFSGHYSGTATNQKFYVKIDGTGTPDTFEWGYADSASPQATGISITGNDQELGLGISINFGATTGHTSGDTWKGTASPVDVDTGFFTNRNTGTSGVGYTHLGMFFDASEDKWVLLDEYSPEPEGTIDLTDSSVSYGILKAASFEGDLTGDISGNADTVDNLHASQFVRSDANDTMTGVLTIQTTDDQKLVLRAPSGDTNDWNYIGFTGRDGTRDAYIGTNGTGEVVIGRDGTAQTIQSTSTGWRIDDYVGFDISSPDRQVHIYGASVSGTNLHIQSTSGSAGLKLSPPSGDAWEIQAQTGSSLIFYNRTDQAYRMVIDTSGKVGIGTDSPGEKLDVDGDVRVRGSGSTMAGTTVANASLLVGSSSVGIGIDDNEIVSSGSHLYLGGVSGYGTIFRVGQTEHMRVHTDGNVGIGTNNPTGLTHWYSTSDYDLIFDYNGQETFKLRHGVSGLYFTGPNTNTLAFGIDQNHDVRVINSSGSTYAMFDGSTSKVGIGTATPDHKLHVQGNTHTSGYFQSSGSALLRKYVSSWSNGDTHDVIYNGWNSTNSDYLYMKVPGNGSTNHGMMVLTDNNGVFFGKASQNTGAATESATNPMPSGSTFAFFNASDAYMAGDVGIGTNAPAGITNARVIDVHNSSTGTGTHSQLILRGSNDHAFLSAFSGDDTGGGDPGFMYHNGHALRFGTAANKAAGSFSEKMRIESDGDVGIGTNAPAEKLHVNGDTQIDGNVKIANDAGMYVFDDTITANSTEDIFTVANTHGAKVFTVMFACSTSAYSVSKMYHVACAHGATPIFNKVVDTGPYGGHDFDVTFTCPYSSDNTKVGVAIINNSTTINANITTTLILGGAPTDITVTEL